MTPDGTEVWSKPHKINLFSFFPAFKNAHLVNIYKHMRRGGGGKIYQRSLAIQTCPPTEKGKGRRGGNRVCAGSSSRVK